MAVRVVSGGELRALLLGHAETPTRLAYFPLPYECSRAFWLDLPESYRRWYVPAERSAVLIRGGDGRVASSAGEAAMSYTRFLLSPGSREAFVVMEHFSGGVI